MRQICTFCKKRDLRETSPSLSVDLSIALKDKVIPSSGTTVEYNELERSDVIGIRVRDNFEAIEAQREYVSLGKSIMAAEKASAAKKESSTPPAEGVN